MNRASSPLLPTLLHGAGVLFLLTTSIACPSSKSGKRDHAVLQPDQRVAPKKVATPDASSSVSRPAPKEILIGDKGTLPKEDIVKVIRANKPKIRACYAAARPSRSGRRDRVLARWVIGPDGAVTEANVESSTHSSAGMNACITREIRGWTFPRVLGGGIVEVRYPFVFEERTP